VLLRGGKPVSATSMWGDFNARLRSAGVRSWWNLYGSTSWLLPLQSYFRSNIRRGHKGEVRSNVSAFLPSILPSVSHTTTVVSVLCIENLGVWLNRSWYEYMNTTVELGLTVDWPLFINCCLFYCECSTRIARNICVNAWHTVFTTRNTSLLSSNL
jgi:hypothetical protein